MHLLHHGGRSLAPGEGLEPPWCRINSAVPYQLGDPGMEPMAGVAPASPVYETGVLAAGRHRRILEAAAGIEPANSAFAERRLSAWLRGRMLEAGPRSRT